MKFDLTSFYNFTDIFVNKLLEYSPKLIAAFAILIVGLYAIKIIKNVVKKIMLKRDFEPTLSKFLADLLIWTLKILLFVIFISKLGIETSSFVAILGAAGLAVGLSLQGSLSNFAGGVLIILFKPFKVGDQIEAQSVIGTVAEIQIFVTKLITSNNQTIFVPNGILSNGIITNFSLENKRRAELFITIPNGLELFKIQNVLSSIVHSNSKVIQEPKPIVEVVLLTESTVKLAVKFWVLNQDFSSVCSDFLEKSKNEITLIENSQS